MLDEAYKLLREQFAACLEIVKDKEDFKNFAIEKWRHSMQVAGAGNYLIRHVKWLQNKPEKFIELVKTAILLHDVCRFAEIVHMSRQETGYDHGVAGSELLRNMPLFMDIRIWLPIKHHGHMIEGLYNDEDYQKIEDENLRQEVEKICFIIRDADKIANLNMLANEDDIRIFFLGPKKNIPQEDGIVPYEAQQEALAGIIVGRQYRISWASGLVTYLSWLTDINYQSAIDFCCKLQITDKLLAFFQEYCTDSEFKHRYTDFVKKMLLERTYIA